MRIFITKSYVAPTRVDCNEDVQMPGIAPWTNSVANWLDAASVCAEAADACIRAANEASTQKVAPHSVPPPPPPPKEAEAKPKLSFIMPPDNDVRP